MSQAYYRTPQMVKGGEFKCYNCNQTLATRLTGSHYEVVLVCRRCKAEITVKCNEAIPFTMAVNEKR